MSTLADLYDPLIMPLPLVRAHSELDRELRQLAVVERAGKQRRMSVRVHVDGAL